VYLIEMTQKFYMH